MHWAVLPKKLSSILHCTSNKALPRSEHRRAGSHLVLASLSKESLATAHNPTIFSTTTHQVYNHITMCLSTPRVVSPSPAYTEAKYALLQTAGTFSTTCSVSSNESTSSGSRPYDNNTVASNELYTFYEVLPDILGDGHFATVRRCIERSTRKEFAIKSIKIANQNAADIKREVSLLRTLDHPSIMKLVDVFEDDEFVHIISEQYTGGELFDKIIENTTDDHCLPESEAARIIHSILSAVEYLHKCNIVHRDIKPENVLFATKQRDSQIKLIDFGLSQIHKVGDPLMTEAVGTVSLK